MGFDFYTFDYCLPPLIVAGDHRLTRINFFKFTLLSLERTDRVVIFPAGVKNRAAETCDLPGQLGACTSCPLCLKVGLNAHLAIYYKYDLATVLSCICLIQFICLKMASVNEVRGTSRFVPTQTLTYIRSSCRLPCLTFNMLQKIHSLPTLHSILHQI